MFAERKAVSDSHNPRAIILIHLLDCAQYLVLNTGIVYIELLVSAYLDRHLLTPILYIKALYDLSERAFVDDIRDKIPIPNLFAYPCPVVAFCVDDLREGLSAVAAHRIDLLELHQLTLLEGGQLVLVAVEGF